jgi:flagellar biosynthesis/type III secretory pathway protein FliH
MTRLGPFLCFAALLAVSAQAQDLHMNESGCSIVLSHSAFAHGYRHGYEEGYHAGNTDISVGAAARTKLKTIKGLKVGYSSQFGKKSEFEKGFHAGLRAGYSDGFAGHPFRAVKSIRALSASLKDTHSPSDPQFTFFDQGFSSGYKDGFEHSASVNGTSAQVDFRHVSCSSSPAKQTGLPAQESYCEGYKRGFALGHADGFALGPDAVRLEASK